MRQFKRRPLAAAMLLVFSAPEWALAQAQSLYSRASKAGLAPESMSEREVIESVGALVDPAASLTAERLGALLLAIVARATDRNLNAEDALRLALGRYRAQVAANEGAR